jgi:hypothetical protein
MGRQGLSTTEGEHGVSLSDSSVTCIDPRRGQAASFRKAREMVLAQQDGGAHHGVTELGDAPAARAGILARIPRRCRRLRRRETCALRGDRCSRAEEAHPQLTVAQVLEGVFAAEDGGEEGEVGGRRGIGRMRRAAVAIPQGAARGARGCDRRARDRRRRRGRRGSGGWPPWRRRRSAGDTPRPWQGVLPAEGADPTNVGSGSRSRKSEVRSQNACGSAVVSQAPPSSMAKARPNFERLGSAAGIG